MEKVTCKEYMPASNNTVITGFYFSNHKLIKIKYSDGKNEKEITPLDVDSWKIITPQHSEEIKRYEVMQAASFTENNHKKSNNPKHLSKVKKAILFLSLVIIAALILLWGIRNDDLVHFVRGYKLYSTTFLLLGLGLTLSILVHIFIPRNIKTWSKKKKYYSLG